jgi:hypothetical protein
MTDVPSQETDLDRPPARRRALPVTITAGMPVMEISDAMPATIVGFTQAFCIYRINETGTLAVAKWRDVALGDVCPAEPLLPIGVTENDRRNTGATVLRQLLALKQFGLTAAQTATLDELVAILCGSAVGS